ncbi:sensor histidine kinase [Paenibacillus montaniterrae]|uniref:sensor histidine kinase n=1 Tax=Paenibacillus montaniterrae TaxID=429341 RepID=UPI001BD191DE|nr:histidine kinase [Paenibacillus montaniterrae]
MIRNVTMKRFIYFFSFFLLITLSLFYVMNKLSSNTVEQSLINASKGQVQYTNSIIEGIIAEASLYGTQFAADHDVRIYKNQILELDNYNYQMKKNNIHDRLEDVLISSQAVNSIGIYWKGDGTYITTSNDAATKSIFQAVNERGWQVIDQSLYYFAVYPYIQQAGESSVPEYIVGVQLKTDYMKNVLLNATNGENSNAYLWVNKEQLWSNQKVHEKIAELVEQNVAENSETDILKFDYHARSGDYYILAKYIPLIDSYLVSYTRASDVLQPLEQNRQLFVVSIAAIVILGLYVIYMFYRNFYRNVHLLQKKFHHVEEGNYGTRITHKTKNEFSNLFNSFNGMVAKIQGLFASLKIETELRHNAELKQLQAQINPHFLYNSLFFITTVAKTSPDAVVQMSKHLAQYYRYMTKLDKDEVTLQTELKLAEHYLAIMALSKQLTYQIKLPPELESFMIKPLMIQPIVENAIQHGIEERQGAHRVTIDVKRVEAGILITVADDGKGLEPQQLSLLEGRINYSTASEGSRGIGLWNVNQRLKNMYSKGSCIRFSNNEWGGLTVEVFIALQSEGGQQDEAVNRG